MFLGALDKVERFWLWRIGIIIRDTRKSPEELNKNKSGIPVKVTCMGQTCLDSGYVGMVQAPGMGTPSHSLPLLDGLDNIGQPD